MADSTTNFSEVTATSSFFSVDIADGKKKKSKKRKCLKVSCIFIWIIIIIGAVGVSLWFWVIPYVLQEETPDAKLVANLVGENRTNCNYTGVFIRDRKGKFIKVCRRVTFGPFY